MPTDEHRSPGNLSRERTPNPDSDHGRAHDARDRHPLRAAQHRLHVGIRRTHDVHARRGHRLVAAEDAYDKTARHPVRCDRILLAAAVEKHHRQVWECRGAEQVPPASPERPGAARKSTRLNSSHDQISYTVFCLKKKKKKNTYSKTPQ